MRRNKDRENDGAKIAAGLKDTCETVKNVLLEAADIEDADKILNDYEEDAEIKKQLNLSLSRIRKMEKDLEMAEKKEAAKKKKIVEKEKINHEAAMKDAAEFMVDKEIENEKNKEEDEIEK